MFFLWSLLRNYFLFLLYSYFFPVERKGKALKVTFYLEGQRRFFYLPPSPHREVGLRAYLVKKGKRREITQPGGYPILVSAKDLGGESIVTESLEGEEKVYGEEERPYLFS